jgi:hypothetical protein
VKKRIALASNAKSLLDEEVKEKLLRYLSFDALQVSLPDTIDST